MLPFKKGTEIDGRYVLHDVSGTGGYASVWKASDKQLNRDVAIKRLFSRQIYTTPDTMRAALDEARKNAQLIHTNIVQVYDIIDAEGEHLIIMEYVDGPSLHAVLRENALKGEVFPLDQSVGMLKDILEGVSYAHSKAICHRDLTPMNILLTSSGVPKIADFGIARVIDISPRGGLSPDTEPEGGTGNKNFMSPEQARGEPADFSSDLFMVGIIGYLLLTGRHPFADPAGLFAIHERISDESYNPREPKAPANLTSSDQRLFREYTAVVARLLRRERAARFSSAREAIDAIDSIMPSIECPHCSERVPEHYRFCGYCGYSLIVTLRGRDDGREPAELTDSSAERLVAEGFELTKMKRWDEAVSKYRAAIDLDSSYQNAYWNLGFALNHVGRYEEALDVLKDGLALDVGIPKHVGRFYYALAYAHSNLKQYSLAIQEVDEALRRQPDSIKYLYLRAKIWLYLGEADLALADAETILRENPEHLGAARLVVELKHNKRMRPASPALDRTTTPLS